MLDDKIKEGLTFDDVLILPAKSKVLPAEADVSTKLTRNIPLPIPIISSAMDTVTDSRMAIALAQKGGIGIVHRNMSIEKHTEEVDKVKRHESGMIVDPITVRPQNKIFEAKEVMKKYRISGLPITDENNKLVGILTNRDIRFETRLNISIDKVMTKELITVPLGTSLKEAEKLFHKHKIEKLLMVDENFHLKGLITYKDILKRIQYPNACKDGFGRLRVGAAIGVSGETLERAKALVQAKADVLVIDTAHGHSQKVLDTVKMIKKELPDQELIAGNIGTTEAAKELIARGMGSIEAMREGSRDRYFQETAPGVSKLVPEGIEGRVPIKGSAFHIIEMMVGGLKSGMGYAGCGTIPDLQEKAKFIKVTTSGMKESHVHDIAITKEAPNYYLD